MTDFNMLRESGQLQDYYRKMLQHKYGHYSQAKKVLQEYQEEMPRQDLDDYSQ